MEGLLTCIPMWWVQGQYKHNGPPWVRDSMLGSGRGCRVGLQCSQEQGKLRGNPAQPGAQDSGLSCSEQLTPTDWYLGHF